MSSSFWNPGAKLKIQPLSSLLFIIIVRRVIELTSTYIDTSTNTHADLLSRGDMEKFFSLPQLFPLQKVKEPALAAMDLLVHPQGRANVSHPGWTLK